MCNYSYQALEVKLPQRVFKYVEFNNSVCVMCKIYTYDISYLYSPCLPLTDIPNVKKFQPDKNED